MIGFPCQSLIRFKGLSISCRSRSRVWVTFSPLLGQHQIFVLRYVVLLRSVNGDSRREKVIGETLAEFFLVLRFHGPKRSRGLIFESVRV